MKRKDKFWSYNRSKKYIRKLGLKGQTEWDKYKADLKRPPYIPSNPWKYYKNKGWVSWMDWLGTKNHRPNERKYKVNDNFFKKWSPNMAYILGFWFTDGNMDDVRNIFNISQHKKDKYLLKAILKEMNSNNPLRLNRNNYSFAIRSKEIVTDIKKLGGIPRKSLTVKFPKIPQRYLSDFIRGLWDGDGSISHVKKLNHYTSSFSCGSKIFIYKVLCVLRKNIKDLRGNIYIDFRKKGKKMPLHGFLKKDSVTYTLHFGVNDTKRLRDFIYKNLDKNNTILKMKRKYNKFVNGGKINICSKDKKYLKFKDARKYIRVLKLSGVNDWKEYCKGGNKSENIPSDVYNVYKDRGWTNWHDFLGISKN